MAERPPTFEHMSDDVRRAYEFFGIGPDATQRETRRVWHEWARRNHPDVGGDTVAFQQGNAQYSTIRDYWASGDVTEDGEDGETEDEDEEFTTSAAAGGGNVPPQPDSEAGERSGGAEGNGTGGSGDESREVGEDEPASAGGSGGSPPPPPPPRGMDTSSSPEPDGEIENETGAGGPGEEAAAGGSGPGETDGAAGLDAEWARGWAPWYINMEGAANDSEIAEDEEEESPEAAARRRWRMAGALKRLRWPLPRGAVWDRAELAGTIAGWMLWPLRGLYKGAIEWPISWAIGRDGVATWNKWYKGTRDVLKNVQDFMMKIGKWKVKGLKGDIGAERDRAAGGGGTEERMAA